MSEGELEEAGRDDQVGRREEAIRKLSAMPEMAGASREALEMAADQLLAFESAPEAEDEFKEELDSRGFDRFGVHRGRTLGFKDEAVEKVEKLRKSAPQPRPFVYDEEEAKRSLAEFLRQRRQAE